MLFALASVILEMQSLLFLNPTINLCDGKNRPKRKKIEIDFPKPKSLKAKNSFSALNNMTCRKFFEAKIFLSFSVELN